MPKPLDLNPHAQQAESHVVQAGVPLSGDRFEIIALALVQATLAVAHELAQATEELRQIRHGR